jgi:formate hydrogenlyase transcriptional activator
MALEALPSGVLIVDAGGTIALVNRELERQFGYTRAELVGQNVDLLLPEAVRLIDAARRAGFADAPSPRSVDAGGQLFGRRKDGTAIPLEIGLRPIQIADGLCVLASIVDTNERAQLERVRQAALEEQLEFERFVAELSGQFINLHADRIDEAIRGGLGRICAQVGLDRASFYKIGEEGELFDCVGWSAPGIPQLDQPMAGKERLPWAVEQVLAGQIVSFSTLDDVPSDVDRATYAALGIRSAVVVPLSVDGRVEGAVGFNAVRAERTWPTDVLHRLGVVASVFGQLLARQRRDEALRAATAEAERLKEQLQSENVYLRREARERLGSDHAVGKGAAVRRVLEQIEQVAATDSTVLLLGETGTGKELFATQIHELSARHGRAMVRVNCAAIPATLIESELFGRERGAFTGALARQIGRFELADHSTIFLDEIGDLPADVQVKLLRVLEERQIERLGSPRPIAVDTRIIAATHRNLEQRIADGVFREDLYYRLSVFPIHVPPLRERVEDIPLLVWGFVEEFSKAFGKRVDAIDKDNLTALQQYAWPGNIRELRNVVERAMIGATGRRLSIPLPHATPAAARRSPKLVDVEKEHIRAVLEGTGWRIRGVAGAAERLGLKPTTLETRMAKLGLRRPGHA